LRILDLLYAVFFPQLNYEHSQDQRMKKLVDRGLNIGKDFYIHPTVIIDNDWPWLITIGDRCTFSANVIILAHDASMQEYVGYVKIGKVTIGSRTFIGAGSIILPGVKIGSDVIVGAGSVVTHDIPDKSVVAGNPAHLVESTLEFIEKHRMRLPPNVQRIRGKESEKPEIKERIKKASNEGPYYL
jgi:maltose O-acetyltransferase